MSDDKLSRRSFLRRSTAIPAAIVLSTVADKEPHPDQQHDEIMVGKLQFLAATNGLFGPNPVVPATPIQEVRFKVTITDGKPVLTNIDAITTYTNRTERVVTIVGYQVQFEHFVAKIGYNRSHRVAPGNSLQLDSALVTPA